MNNNPFLNFKLFDVSVTSSIHTLDTKIYQYFLSRLNYKTDNIVISILDDNLNNISFDEQLCEYLLNELEKSNK